MAWDTIILFIGEKLLWIILIILLIFAFIIFESHIEFSKYRPIKTVIFWVLMIILNEIFLFIEIIDSVKIILYIIIIFQCLLFDLIKEISERINKIEKKTKQPSL